MKLPRAFRSIVASACVLLLTPAPIHAADLSAVNEVLKLKQAGLSDDSIRGFILGKNANYNLSADDIISLQQQGFSSGVIDAMIASGKTATVVPMAQTPVTVTSSTPVAPPAGFDANAVYFYQELTPYGRWLQTEDNQWYWQPKIVVTSSAWKPYSDGGHWVSTDNGWYWASDYPWGWAAFHYGRWQLHPHFGWIWLPDRTWGPAWVAWRSGGDYCGWAPLPPGAIFDMSSGRFSYRGKVVGADFDFGLGWMHFNFCVTKELGDAHWHPVREVETRTIFEKTKVIVGHRVVKTVVHGESGPHLYNVGIEQKRVAEVRGAPIQEMHVQDMRSPAGGGAHETVVQEQNELHIYRPQFNAKKPGRRGDGR